MSNLQSVIESYGVHPELGKEANGFWIEQSPYELAAFLEAIEPLGIKTVLEIGTGHKAGLARFMSEFLGWKVVSVDIHQPFVKAPLVDLRVSESRIDFGSTRFDLVILDADHQHDSVKADYEWYGKYADKVVMFHDIAGLRGCEGARDYWDELTIGNSKDGKLVNGYHEIYDPNEASMCGIGWINVQFMDVTEVISQSRDTLAKELVETMHSEQFAALTNPDHPDAITPPEPPTEEAPKTAASRKGRKRKGNDA